MYKTIISLVSLLALMACGRSGYAETSEYEVASSLQSTEMTEYEPILNLNTVDIAGLELAPNLLFYQELANMLSYETSVSLEGQFIVRDVFSQSLEHLFSVTFPIEYFDGENWLVIPPTDEFLTQNLDHPILWEKGPVEFRSTYDFAWITDAGLDIENGLFRIRERISLSDEFPIDTSHDLVFEFSLSDVGTTIRNLDVPDDLRVNPNLNDVILTMEFLIDEHYLSGYIINSSDVTISASHPSLEYFDGEVWYYVVAPYFSFTDIGWRMPPGSEGPTGLPLEFYEISEGYPLRFRIEVHPYDDNSREVQHDLVFEFTLE